MKQIKKRTGRVPNADKGMEVKVSRPVYLLPSQLEKIKAKYGSLTAAVEKKILRAL